MIELLSAEKDLELRGLIKTIEKRQRKTEDEMIEAGLILIEASIKAEYGEWQQFLDERGLTRVTAHYWMVKAGHQPKETAKSSIEHSTKTRNNGTTKTGKPQFERIASVKVAGQLPAIYIKGKEILDEITKDWSELSDADIEAAISDMIQIAELFQQAAAQLRNKSHRKPALFAVNA